MFMYKTIERAQPDEIYNLAAQSHVKDSFDAQSSTFEANINGLLHICEAVLALKLSEKAHIFHASTSEMYGDVKRDSDGKLIDEAHPFNPMSPYAVSKIAAYYLVQYYKSVHRFFICTGMTFNHESPLRHETFITRKITKAVARIRVGLQSVLRVGNIYAKRDWGHAFDYITGFWKMLNKQ